MKKRNLTSDLQKLARAFYKNLDLRVTASEVRWSIGLDPKRPFGNGDVESDILEIIGMKRDGDEWTEEQLEYTWMLYQVKLVPYLRRQFELHLPTKKSLVKKHPNSAKKLSQPKVDLGPDDRGLNDMCGQRFGEN